jgi:maltooligosyltrehalose trehalohydrolase
MKEFRVWAPTCDGVEVVWDKHFFEMDQSERGWWSVNVADAEPGHEYQFRLNKKLLCPDPRSQFQARGVHGPSTLVDLKSFAWTDHSFQARPLAAAVLYELHTGTFTPEGTFESAIARLDHLARLGVTHVELMPVAEFAGVRGWGYDGVYPFAPHHAYGGPQGLAKLVNACHERGLGVILDVVYNHLGPDGNYLGNFGPYFTEDHKTPWGSSLNFDGPYSDEVRQYFVDNATMWLRDYHFDGLRLDAVHAILDTSAFPFLEQLAADVKHLEAQLGRYLVLIAESNLNNPRIVQPRERGGFGFHAHWNDDFHHALHAALTEETQGYYSDFGGIDDLACVFRRPYLYEGRFSPYRLRSHGRPAEGMHASSFIAYSQNHDQVGNRATGERLHQLLSVDLAKVAAALTILSPYVPLIFQGEEWAASSPFQYFVDFSGDPELAQAVVEGRRKEFAGLQDVATVPDPQDVQTFKRSRLVWDELDKPDQQEMLAWYKQLIATRRRIPALVDGRMERVSTTYDIEFRTLVVRREGMFLAVNLGQDECALDLPLGETATIEISSTPDVRTVPDRLMLPGQSVALISCTPSADDVHKFQRPDQGIALGSL